MSKTSGYVRSKKGFYIGDICYVLPEKIYYGFWGEKCKWQDGVHQLPDCEHSFAVGGTFYGDGTYHDNEGRSYDVDAGVLGVVPLELVEPTIDECKKCGYVIERAGTCFFESDDGRFIFSLRGMNDIHINTVCGTVWDSDCEDDNFEDCDEDDFEDCDEDDEY